MNNQFDELTKAMAQSVTRRQAFKKFGFGLAGMALGCLGLASKAEATTPSQCLGKYQLCGSGGLQPPANCAINCCSHNAFRSMDGHFRAVWLCT
jgi:hypothetical protein